MDADHSRPNMDPASFEELSALARRECGLKLRAEKRMMVQSRLRHRLRALQMNEFQHYVKHVCSDAGISERRHMISALTTNVSHFFREAHHFTTLSDRLGDVIRKKISDGRRIRIWSAGCSNGQEPYSIAMYMLRNFPKLSHSDFRILATDIDPKVVDFARNATYSERQVAGLSAADKQQFTDVVSDLEDNFKVKKTIRDCIRFHELNLFSEWPMRYKFDAIYCRNVVIYFDQTAQESLWSRFHAELESNGLFFLGHSERISSALEHGFKSVGPTSYERIERSLSKNGQSRKDIHGTS
ncbi:CheR family methyltransferase [uncultured Tateyamaria sp.]|uniref:CheR family methyltransferase n=2 Tax=uncultured Tateyamaria sp. TaxID=455651 RepID=UPI00343343C3